MQWSPQEDAALLSPLVAPHRQPAGTRDTVTVASGDAMPQPSVDGSTQAPRSDKATVAEPTVVNKRLLGGYEAPVELKLQHDAVILRVASETNTDVYDSWRWEKVARHLRMETMSEVLPARCRDRYYKLMKMSKAQIQTRFGRNSRLLKLAQTAQAVYAQRNGAGPVRNVPGSVTQQLTDLPTVETLVAKLPSVQRHGAALGENDTDSIPHQPREIPTAQPAAVATSTPRKTTQRPDGWLTTRVVACDVANEAAAEATQADAAVFVASSETIEKEAAPPAVVGEDDVANPSPVQVETGAITPAPGYEDGLRARTDQEEIAALKKTVEAMTVVMMRLHRQLDQAKTERVELQDGIKRMEDLAAGSVNSEARTAELERQLVSSGKEIVALRAELTLVKGGIETSGRDMASCRFVANKCMNEATQYKNAMLSLRTDLTNVQRELKITTKCVETVMSLHTAQSAAIVRVNTALATRSGATASIGHDELRLACKEAEIRQQQWFARFADEEKRKREAFASEIHAQHELNMASLKEEIEKVYEELEQSKIAIKELKQQTEDSESRDRERQVLFFEMVEAETVRREELAASVEQKWVKCDHDLQELVANVETHRRMEKDNRRTQEESVVWFQEEVQRQVEELGASVHQELSVYSNELKALQDGRGGQALGDHVLEMNKHHDDIKRLLREQYLKLTVQNHELRDAMNAGLEKERRDRCQGLTTMLQNIQELLAFE